MSWHSKMQRQEFQNTSNYLDLVVALEEVSAGMRTPLSRTQNKEVVDIKTGARKREPKKETALVTHHWIHPK